MEESNPVYIVSLGPGEAGLVSVEGSGVLCRADVIFCPKTDMRSRSSVLLKKMKIREEVVRHYALPMNKNREMAYEAYDKVFEESVRLRSEGLCVAIVAEGDAGFYSSTGYSCPGKRERRDCFQADCRSACFHCRGRICRSSRCGAGGAAHGLSGEGGPGIVRSGSGGRRSGGSHEAVAMRKGDKAVDCFGREACLPLF